MVGGSNIFLPYLLSRAHFPVCTFLSIQLGKSCLATHLYPFVKTNGSGIAIFNLPIEAFLTLTKLHIPVLTPGIYYCCGKTGNG